MCQSKLNLTVSAKVDVAFCECCSETREYELRGHIPHTWVCSTDNYLKRTEEGMKESYRKGREESEGELQKGERRE